MIYKMRSACSSRSSSASSQDLYSPDSQSWSGEDDSVFTQPVSPVEVKIESQEVIDSHSLYLADSDVLFQEKDVLAKRESRRTRSINSAFTELRNCIPNVPADTKLSKIKTLRLAISYIRHLMDSLEDQRYMVVEQAGSRKQGAVGPHHENTRRLPRTSQCRSCIRGIKRGEAEQILDHNSTMKRGRTGWPQCVWALELRQ